MDDRYDSLEKSILSDPETINRIRENNGVRAIAFDSKSHDDKIKENQDLMTHITNAVNGISQDGQRTQEGLNSIDWLNNLLQKTSEDLRFDKRDMERNVGQNTATDLNANAVQNKANLQAANTETNLNEVFDSIFKDPTLDSLLQSFNIGPYELMSSPDRAAASLELAKAVHLAKNFDAEVDKRVKIQMEANREKKNLSSPGSQGNSKSATGNQSVVDENGVIQNSKDEFDFMMS